MKGKSTKLKISESRSTNSAVGSQVVEVPSNLTYRDFDILTLILGFNQENVINIYRLLLFECNSEENFHVRELVDI